MEIKKRTLFKYTEFNFCHYLTLQEDEGGKGLKLKRFLQFGYDQCITQKKKLDNYFLFYFLIFFLVFGSETRAKFSFSTSYNLKAAKLP